MRLSHALICCSLAVSLLAPCSAHADTIDPPAAREQLKQGYALKQAGKYSEALDHLNESLRLDPQIKTLMNLADCEESLGKLSQAQKHWLLARDQATSQAAQPFLAVAEKRLAALEARMPRLTVNRIGPAVEGIGIRRDGVLLEGVSLGTPLPTDPGKHEVVVTAPGHAANRYSVSLVEKDSKVLDVTPGPADATPVLAPPVPPVTPPAPVAPAVAPESSSPEVTHTDTGAYWSTQRVIAVGAATLGVVGLGLAGYSWAHANSQHNAALATCNPDCSGDGRRKQTDAVSSVHLSNAMLITGSVLIAGGAVLWFSAPSSRSTTVGLAPVAGPSEAGLVATGTF